MQSNVKTQQCHLVVSACHRSHKSRRCDLLFVDEQSDTQSFFKVQKSCSLYIPKIFLPLKIKEGATKSRMSGKSGRV